MLFSYIGNSAGAMFSGLLSQTLRSRRKSVAISLALLVLAVCIYVALPYHNSLPLYYAVCGLLGFATGYWAMFVQMGAEQFGTDIRATAATSIPNMVRGSFPAELLDVESLRIVKYLSSRTPSQDVISRWFRPS